MGTGMGKDEKETNMEEIGTTWQKRVNTEKLRLVIIV